MQKTKSNVSIVIPSFNGKKLLELHLPSVFKTARRQDEIIIVDDASNDNSFSWMKKKFNTS